MKVGYEFSFNRYFYKPQPMRTPEEIRADILALGNESEGVLRDVLATAPRGAPGKLRIYADTSVIGGCEDEEFRARARRLFEEFRKGRAIPVLSDLTLRELAGAPDRVRAEIGEVPRENTEMIHTTDEVERLAAAYTAAGALGPSSRVAALHVALASLTRVDILASWNFKHMVNWRRIRAYNEVNRRMGYSALDIRTPGEVNDED